MKRVLHLVRSTLPAPVAGPDDVVIYTVESQRAEGRVWHPEAHEHDGRTIDTRELIELLFELDAVAVW